MTETIIRRVHVKVTIFGGADITFKRVNGIEIRSQHILGYPSGFHSLDPGNITYAVTIHKCGLLKRKTPWDFPEVW
ncbi:hypothetical protein [Membranihabitans maritimus]|uniref:hypothetical protein n=1 Tax=Membranihabitans maritimus TaxID=2904244 RepID=UPI001F3AD0B7|nr:hypothetical protein [Membranihabitans maritimus]